MIKKLFLDLTKGSCKYSGYFDVYEKHLNKFVGKSPKILEIGIFDGGSLELWEKYFGDSSKIFGVDIHPDVLNQKHGPNTKILLGNQGDSNFWDNFLKEETGFDIIIDDGSHIMRDQILTLEKLFPHLNDGGVYICEDTHTSYWDGWQSQNSETFLNYSKKITDVVNQQHYRGKTPVSKSELDIYSNLYSVSYYNSVVVFEKRHNLVFEPIDTKNKVNLHLLSL